MRVLPSPNHNSCTDLTALRIGISQFMRAELSKGLHRSGPKVVRKNSGAGQPFAFMPALQLGKQERPDCTIQRRGDYLRKRKFES